MTVINFINLQWGIKKLPGTSAPQTASLRALPNPPAPTRDPVSMTLSPWMKSREPQKLDLLAQEGANYCLKAGL